MTDPSPTSGPRSARPPFWGTKEFRWLVGILVVVMTVSGILLFELGPRQEALREKRLDRFPALAEDFRPRPGPSKLPLDTALSEALATARDPTPVGETDRAHRALIDYLARAPNAVIAEEAHVVAYEVFARRSAELRGQPFRITALMLHWTQVALVPPAATTEFVYRTYLMDPGGEEAYVVDLLEEPRGLSRRDVVRAEALYLRRGSYETENRIVDVPQLLGHSIRAVESATEERRSPLLFSTLGTALSVLAVGLVILTVYVRRRSVTRLKRAAPQWPTDAAGGKAAEAPWEGFVERSWKAAAAPVPRSGWVPRPSQHRNPAAAGSAARRRPLLLRVGPWLVISSVVCAGLATWTAYRIWRESQPPAPVVIDFDAESMVAVRDAETARERVRRVQESLLTAAPASSTAPPTIDAPSTQELEAGLGSLERAAERLQELLFLARRGGRDASDPMFQQRGLDFARLGFWILDASDLLKLARGQGTSTGFFLPYLQLAAARTRIDAEVAALASSPATPANISALKEQIDNQLRLAAELESYLKVGLERDSLEPADIPEIAALGADRKALEQHRETVTKLLANL